MISTHQKVTCYQCQQQRPELFRVLYLTQQLKHYSCNVNLLGPKFSNLFPFCIQSCTLLSHTWSSHLLLCKHPPGPSPWNDQRNHGLQAHWPPWKNKVLWFPDFTVHETSQVQVFLRAQQWPWIFFHLVWYSTDLPCGNLCWLSLSFPVLWCFDSWGVLWPWGPFPCQDSHS